MDHLVSALHHPKSRVVSGFGFCFFLSLLVFYVLIPVFTGYAPAGGVPSIFSRFSSFTISNGEVSGLGLLLGKEGGEREGAAAGTTHLRNLSGSPVLQRADKENILEKTHDRKPSENAAAAGSSGKESILEKIAVFDENISVPTKQGDASERSFGKCDIFDGRWVWDARDPYYTPGSCPYVGSDFNCLGNGRPDRDFLKWRWQPNACNIPRLNATDFLMWLKGKRLIFVGDSLNRNMWESLVCILRHSVADKKQVFEISGRTQFKTRGHFSFRFKDYDCSVDYVLSPFLVREEFGNHWWRPDGGKLRLDLMDDTTSRYRDAHIVVFNTGHWWNHEKTSKGINYYKEGNQVHHVRNVMEAYEKALKTWAEWVDKNINTKKTRVIFRGYSPMHFRGGEWNSGGQCHKETEPNFNGTFFEDYLLKMIILESVLKKMKTPVMYLNISRLTDYRKDGHPSVYRKKYTGVKEQIAAEKSQDCSHWCLPGIPDTWNELLYASLLMDDRGSWRS